MTLRVSSLLCPRNWNHKKNHPDPNLPIDGEAAQDPCLAQKMVIGFCFGSTLNCIPGVLLVLHSKITPGKAKGSCEVPGTECGTIEFKASALEACPCPAEGIYSVSVSWSW